MKEEIKSIYLAIMSLFLWSSLLVGACLIFDGTIISVGMVLFQVLCLGVAVGFLIKNRKNLKEITWEGWGRFFKAEPTLLGIVLAAFLCIFLIAGSKL